MRIKQKLLVVGVVTVAVAGASGVAVAASSTGGAGTSLSAPRTATVAKPAGRTAGGNLFDAKGVALLAARLRVPLGQARTVAARVEHLAARGSIDPNDPEFVSIAKSVGATPQTLAAALDAVKRAQG